MSRPKSIHFLWWIQKTLSFSPFITGSDDKLLYGSMINFLVIWLAFLYPRFRRMGVFHSLSSCLSASALSTSSVLPEPFSLQVKLERKLLQLTGGQNVAHLWEWTHSGAVLLCHLTQLNSLHHTELTHSFPPTQHKQNSRINHWINCF